MRIRKRSVPLPFSILSPSTTATSDPPLKPDHYEQQKKLHPSVSEDDLSLKSKTHVHNQQSDSVNQSLKLEDQVTSGSSDLQLTLIRGENGWICSDGVRNDDKEDDEYWCMNDTNQDQVEKKKKNKMTLQGGVLEEEEEEEEMKIRRGNEDKKNKNRRSNNMISSRLGASAAEVVSGSLSFNISSTDHLHQGKKKKRRGRLFDHERKEEVGEVYYDDDHAMMIMKKDNKKTNANKNWVHEKDQEKEKEKEEEDISSSIVKKIKRENGRGGGGVMEGSRCSRVNGRGWRCCQQTLVGYSLCEHHLGKGRLRSMSSVRGSRCTANVNYTKRKKNIRNSIENNSALSLSKSSQAEDEVDDDNEEEVEEKKEMVTEKPLSKKMMNKNIKITKKKIGMVKARSISSLLGQTQQYYGTSCCSSS